MIYLVDTAELVLALLLRDTVEHKASLRVVQQAEQVARLLDLHHVCSDTSHHITHRRGKGAESGQ